MTKSKRDIYQECTDTIIHALENDPGKWKSGLSGLLSGFPIRNNGEYYKGINVILLSISAMKNGYGSDQWLTYKQAKSIGANVKKGESGTGIIFFKVLESENANGDISKFPMIRGYTVFNADQIENLPESYTPEIVLTDWSNIDSGELLFSSSFCEVKTINQTPHYAPELDYIGLPEKAKFDSAENYYSTLAHEISHSTGHKDRLDRTGITGDRTKANYAFEELIAELSAVFVCSQIGISGNLENHASYLSHWLTAMKEDKKYIFKAASQAQKSSELILARMAKTKTNKAA